MSADHKGSNDHHPTHPHPSLLHSTNAHLCLLSLEHANLAAGRELMNGRGPATEATLVLFLQPMRRGLVVSLFLPNRRSESALYFKRPGFDGRFNKKFTVCCHIKRFLPTDAPTPPLPFRSPDTDQPMHSPVTQSALSARPAGKRPPIPRFFLFLCGVLRSC